MEIKNFQANPNVNISNGINKIKFGVGWGEEHNQVEARWNFRVLPKLVPSQYDVRSYSLVIPNQAATEGQWGILNDFDGKGTIDFSLEFENKAPSSAVIQFYEGDEFIEIKIGGWLNHGTPKTCAYYKNTDSAYTVRLVICVGMKFNFSNLLNNRKIFSWI